MAARVPAILGRDPQADLQPVLDYIQAQGVTGLPLSEPPAWSMDFGMRECPTFALEVTLSLAWVLSVVDMIHPAVLTSPELWLFTECKWGRNIPAGDALVRTLKDYPRLLLFAPEGKNLKFGNTYASVDVVEETNRGHVSYWREGTAFSTAPVSPRTPNSQLNSSS